MRQKSFRPNQPTTEHILTSKPIVERTITESAHLITLLPNTRDPMANQHQAG